MKAEGKAKFPIGKEGRRRIKIRGRVEAVVLVIPTRRSKWHRHNQATLLARACHQLYKRGKLGALIGETEGSGSKGLSRVNPLQQLKDVMAEKTVTTKGLMYVHATIKKK